MATEVLDWLSLPEPKGFPSKLSAEQIRRKFAQELAKLILTQAEGSEAPPAELCLETAILAASLFAVGWGEALPTEAKSRHTLLQTWRHVFLLTMGPRRVLLKTIGLPGRGRGGLLFDPNQVERELLLNPTPVDISQSFAKDLLGLLGSFGWTQEGAAEIGLTIQAVDDLVELLDLGHSYGHQIPDRVETKAEALAAMARIWVGSHPELLPVPLNRRVAIFGSMPDLVASENHTTEFKAGFEWDPKQRRINGHLRQSLLRAVAGMLNSEGGCIWLGVNDAGQAVGLEREAGRLGSRRPIEALELKVRNYLRRHIPAAAWCVSAEQTKRGGRSLIKLTVVPHQQSPISLSEKNPTTGKLECSIYLRSGPQTIRLTPEDEQAWLAKFSPAEPESGSPRGGEQPPCQP